MSASEPTGKLLAFASADLPYQLFLPTLATPHRRPAIVFLHGGGDGPFEVMNRQSLPSLLTDNQTFASNFPFVTLLPCSTCRGSPRGWVGQNFAKVNRLIEMLVHQHRVDPHRIALTGQSMGGGGLWRYAAEYPRLFSALVPVCAASQPTAALVDRVCCKEGPTAGCCPPVWAFHGGNDAVVPVSLTDKWTSLLRKGGRGQEVRYTRYPWSPPPPMAEFANLHGHASYEQSYRDPNLYEWLLEQRCGACSLPRAGSRRRRKRK